MVTSVLFLEALVLGRGEPPCGFDAGDDNLRRYVGNGPTSATDPTGLKALPDNSNTAIERAANGWRDLYAGPNENPSDSEKIADNEKLTREAFQEASEKVNSTHFVNYQQQHVWQFDSIAAGGTDSNSITYAQYLAFRTQLSGDPDNKSSEGVTVAEAEREFKRIRNPTNPNDEMALQDWLFAGGKEETFKEISLGSSSISQARYVAYRSNQSTSSTNSRKESGAKGTALTPPPDDPLEARFQVIKKNVEQVAGPGAQRYRAEMIKVWGLDQTKWFIDNLQWYEEQIEETAEKFDAPASEVQELEHSRKTLRDKFETLQSQSHWYLKQNSISVQDTLYVVEESMRLWRLHKSWLDEFSKAAMKWSRDMVDEDAAHIIAFQEQMRKDHKDAEKGIEIIGELPLYVWAWLFLRFDIDPEITDALLTGKLPDENEDPKERLLRRLDYLASILHASAHGDIKRINCFPAGTLVQTVAGPKPIEQLRPGSAVWSFDFAKGEWVQCAVEINHTSVYTGIIVELSFADGTELEVTEDHPFWVLEGEELDKRPQLKARDAYENSCHSLPGRWVHSQALRVGDCLASRQGMVAIHFVRRQERSLPVHNLAVRGLPYYAVGPNGVLVHNSETIQRIEARLREIETKLASAEGDARKSLLLERKGLQIDLASEVAKNAKSQPNTGGDSVNRTPKLSARTPEGREQRWKEYLARKKAARETPLSRQEWDKKYDNAINNPVFGNQFENEVREALGTGRGKEVQSPSGVTTRPDVDWGESVTEVKDYINLNFEENLPAQADAAEAAGVPFNVIISPRTQTVSIPLQQRVRELGGRILQFDPATKTFSSVRFNGNKVFR
jgi:hypothetical protein